MITYHYYSIRGDSTTQVVATLTPGSINLVGSTITNHELWQTCPICGCQYDVRIWGDCCEDCHKEFKTS